MAGAFLWPEKVADLRFDIPVNVRGWMYQAGHLLPDPRLSPVHSGGVRALVIP
jgi:hypothetical protein